MAANGISTLGTKQAKQEAKLALATTDRIASGETRTTLNINQLPTKYTSNAITDNPNQDSNVKITSGNATVTFSNVGLGYFAANVGIYFLNPNAFTGTSAVAGNIYLHANGAIKSFELRNTGDGYRSNIGFRASGACTYSAFGAVIVNPGLILGRPWT